MKANLVKLSLCPCGFPLLADHIKLGQEYEVEDTITSYATLICGGCHAALRVNCVWVHARGAAAPGFLPAEIFGLK